MHCCITEMRYKEVICVSNGCRLGNVCDVEVDTCSGRVVAFVIYGTSKFFGLFGKTPDIRICWEDIDVIGEDTILVKCCPPDCADIKQKRKSKLFDGMFR